LWPTFYAKKAVKKVTPLRVCPKLNASLALKSHARLVIAQWNFGLPISTAKSS
jgi:hypothetical protein